MKTIAIVSLVGGAGRTTLTTTLASLLQARKTPAFAVECNPCNVLAFHYGAHAPVAAGLSSHLLTAQGDLTINTALRSDDGVLFVPWGNTDSTSDVRSSLASKLHATPNWLRNWLAGLDFPEHQIALLDTPTWPSVYTDQAIHAADLILTVMPPTPLACAVLPAFQAMIEASQIKCVYISNAVIPGRQLHTDIQVMLRAILGQAMLPYHIHADSGIPEALARGENFSTSHPNSQAAHDLQGLASWISAWANADSRAGERT